MNNDNTTNKTSHAFTRKLNASQKDAKLHSWKNDSMLYQQCDTLILEYQ